MAEIELAEGVASLPRDAWNALVRDESPFLEWDFLAALEEAGCVGGASDNGTGWLARPLVLRDAGRLVAACPVYLKGHSEGEFVFDWSWADAAARAGIRYYPKLLVGVPFTPVTGARVLAAEDVDAASVRKALADALRELCLGNDLSSVHVNFCGEDEAAAFASAGFVPRTGVQYHWRNEGYAGFDDFLARFRSKRRNQIQRELRSVAASGIEVTACTGDAIPEDAIPLLHRIYLATVDRNPWGRRYLNAPLFAILASRWRERLSLVLARREGKIVAGAINVEKGDALYGRYWGALEEVRDLHFVVCYYAGIEHCIRRGLARFEPGAGGDYKQLRGFDATPTRSAHFLADPRLRAAVERALAQEREAAAREIGWLREQSALKAT